MDIVTPFLFVLAGMAVVMAMAWLVQLGTRNGGWVDAFWSFGTGAACVTAALWPDAAVNGTRQWLVAGLAALWSLRLGAYIAHRVAKDAHEDKRYAGLRTEWGGNFQRNMIALCLIQAPAAALLSLSIFAAAHGGAAELGARDALAVLVLAIAVLGEGMADEQMRRFRAKGQRGAVMDKGLWGWSRHPNYFFEWVGWLAWPVMALDPAVAWSWLTLVAPVMMFLILRFGTGVPALEKTMLESRGDLFRDYQRRVSAFFPFPPTGSST